MDLSVREVGKLLEQLLASGHAGRHVGHVRGVLRSAIAHAMRQEMVARNVAALASSPPVRRHEARTLSRADLAKLFTALEGERLRPLVITAATLGLRHGECRALKWSDIDWDRATLTVRRTGSRIRGQYMEGHAKTPRSQRR